MFYSGAVKPFVMPAVAHRLSYGLALFLAVAVSISYLPFLTDLQVMGMSVAGLWHKLLLGVFALLALLSLWEEQPLVTDVVKLGGLLIICLLLEWLVLSAFSTANDFGGEIRMMLIPLCALWVGFRMRMDEKRLKVLFCFFALGILGVGLTVVFGQGSGFRIVEQYFSEQKNAIGPILATAAVLCMSLAVNANGRKTFLQVLLGLALSGLCVLLILTIRARAALLAVALVLLLMLFQRFKGSYLLLSLWLALLLGAAVFFLLPDSLKDYVHRSLFSGFSGGDISSGRMARNDQAIRVWVQNPLLGHLVNPEEVAVVHNYPLWKLYKYGLIGALPMLLAYVVLLVADVKTVLEAGRGTLMSAGAYAVLVLYVVSMFEYTFPFGPGTATVMNFFLMGVALRARNSKEKNLFYLKNENQ
ncbi:MAG: hypothetical protein J5644_10895 [Bacteroidales bacterium]|nr:hypothetical protein [Bacteroidales bacterium]